MAASNFGDSGQLLRRLPIAVGILGGSLLLANRLATPTLLSSQSRSDALGIVLSAILILTGLLWQRVQPKPPDSVELVGEQRFECSEDLSEQARAELAWASKLLLTNTVTQAVVVWWCDPQHPAGRQILRRGILPSQPMTTAGAIAQRSLQTQKPIYLVDLKLFPGRIEFSYLPENTQGVICQPLGEGEASGLLILGANAPRSYSKQDENWIRGIAEKLAVTLSEAEPDSDS